MYQGTIQVTKWFLEVCDLTANSNFGNLSCTFSPKKRAERHAGPRKMDLQMDQKVRIFFWEDFVRKMNNLGVTHHFHP